MHKKASKQVRSGKRKEYRVLFPFSFQKTACPNFSLFPKKKKKHPKLDPLQTAQAMRPAHLHANIF